MFSKEDVLFECVPNFSEGRNIHIINCIADEIKNTPDVALLNTDMGYDANRTVFTFAGKPDAIIQAGFKAVKKAYELIDMRVQNGSHLRMGACDVFPIIPLQNCTMQDAVLLSQTLGKKIGDKLDIPVYLYEQSASIASRKNLADLRKGEYESIAGKIYLPEWKPDFGKPIFNEKFGMMALGARDFLIAYNINLNTQEEHIAKTIAAKIRSIRNTDLPFPFQFVKAIGWYQEAFLCAQVSMNITQIYESKILDVFRAVQKLAEDDGVSVNGSELIGLIPLQALYYPNMSVSEVINELGLNSVKPFSPDENILEIKLGLSDGHPA